MISRGGGGGGVNVRNPNSAKYLWAKWSKWQGDFESRALFSLFFSSGCRWHNPVDAGTDGEGTLLEAASELLPSIETWSRCPSIVPEAQLRDIYESNARGFLSENRGRSFEFA